MSGHKPQHGKNDPPSGKKHTEGEKESTNRHVYVEPGVQIDLVQDLKKTYQSGQADSTTHNNKQLFWTKISAALLFIVALIYSLQLLQMVISNKLTRESVEVVQAAVVSLTNTEIKQTPKENFPYYLFMTPFVNGGNTATRTGKVYWSVYVPPFSKPIPEDYTFPDQGMDEGNGGTFILGPKQTAYTRPIGIPKNLVQDMLARDRRIYFYGWATYRDRFKETPNRLTEFCYEFWNIVTNPPSTEEGIIVNVCEHHNCYDDECPDYKEKTKAMR